MTRILIAEDDPKVAALLDRGLRQSGLDTLVIGDGVAAVEAVRDGGVDLVLLDLNLPGLDGLGAIAMMRALQPGLPVLMVTGRDTPDDLLLGFDAGADDYITKPFRFDEVLARVRSRLRIATGGTSALLHHDRLTLDLFARTATIDGRAVELSAREFALAEEFLRRSHEILSRDELHRRVWGFATEQGSNVVDVYVGYLRRKLGDDVIETVRGLGYRLGSGAPPNGHG